MTTLLTHENYRWMFREAEHLASATSSNGRFCDASDALLERLGYSREELLQLGPQDIASPATLTHMINEYLPRLKHAGFLRHAPVEYQTKSGQLVKLVANTRAATRDQQLITISSYREVDEWDKISHRFKTLYQRTPTMLHTLDTDGRLLEVSDHWLNRLGYTREEVIGRDVAEFYTQATRDDLAQGSLTRVSFSNEYTNHPREMLTKKGEIREVLISASRVLNRRGDLMRLQVAIKDVTDRNKAQRELQNAFEENARLRRELEQERDYLRESVHVSMNYGEIIGSSPSLRSMLSRIDAVAFTTANVLIVGESGTGKELVSHAIHSRSQRKDQPLITVNCASIPRELFESEFFGHMKGAFTGATRDRIGRFQLANKGTIFLDEVGEIPLELQGKLLRVLQQQEYERVGDDNTRSLDVRVIAATNRDLSGEVAAGRFREDLYYRLNVFPIDVPPLRERGDDVVQIATHLIKTICDDQGRPPIPLTERDIRAMREYDWPGNVRELKNVLERAIILSTDNRLRLSVPQRKTAEATDTAMSSSATLANDYLTEVQMQALIKKNLETAMRIARGKISGDDGAAELLGLRPTTLADRLRAYDIDAPSFKPGRPRRVRHSK